MKTNTLYMLASATLLSVSFASCTDNAQEFDIEQPQALKQIVMTTQDFELEAGSRTFFDITDDAVKSTWAAIDTVGVFPDEGIQTCFPMASGAGTKNATFDGGGWALKDGRTYAAYYPCIGKFYLDKNAVPVSYIGQTQTGNASTAHLGAYDYMVATPTTSVFGSAHFTFKHLSALVQLKITIPVPTSLTSVKLVTDTEAFVVKGEVDIMADAPSIKSVTSVKEIVLNLQEVTTTEDSQVATFYMMIPPVDLSGQTLKAVIVSDKGTQEIAFEGKNFKAGTAYGLSGKMEGYKDGVVTIAKSGTMKQLLGDDFLNITSLKVVGPINGDDVLCLRQMLGGSEFDDTEKGELATLDLSDASIVEGGGKYISRDFTPYYTSNDEFGDYMFCECTNLQSVVLPDGITSIGKLAFCECSSLASVDMPDCVTEIGRDAFTYCVSLVSVDMSAGITLIDEQAFYGCSSLVSVNITDVSSWYNIEFCSPISNPLYNDKAELYLNGNELTELTIPSGVKQIKKYAFYGCNSLTNVTMSNDVTSIGHNAFYACSSLVSVDMSDGVTSMGVEVFSGCSSLTSIDIPDGVTSLSYGTFSGCSSLVSIDIPANVTSIGSSAFSGCSSLMSLDIPEGVTSIGSSAFSGCSSLTSIAIPEGITSIGDYVFSGCSSLISVDMPTDVTSIGSSAFSRCSSLTSIDIPDGVTSIGLWAFYKCSSLTSVNITDLSAWCNITFEDYDSNPLYNGAKLYLDNDELTELVIPADIKRIKDYAFYGYESLKKVTMGEEVISIGIKSFRNCSSLTQVYCNGTTPPTINPSSANSSFNGSSNNRTLYVLADCVSKYQSSDWGTYFTNIVEME